MDLAHKKILLEKRLALVQDLILDEDLFSVLRASNVITQDMQEKIESKQTAASKAGALLDILPRRGKKAFNQFLKALKETRQQHLVNLLSCNLEPSFVEFDEQDTIDNWMRNIEDIVKEIEAPGPKEDEPGIMNVKVIPMTENLRRRLKQADVYELNPERKALAVVVNNQYFPKFDTRNSTEYDLKNLKNLFSQLNFEVVDKEELSAEKIVAEINEAKKKLDSGLYDIFMLCIMSHGVKGAVFGNDQKKLSICDDILASFNDKNCPKMAGKPKLFLIQACQNVTKKAEEKGESSQAGIDIKNFVWNNPDILLALATAEGFVALRDANRGSWFIRSIVYVFANRACKNDIVELMNQVCEIMSNFRANGVTDGQTAQISSMCQITQRKDTLTKKLFFTR